jgi:hypothetical protein
MAWTNPLPVTSWKLVEVPNFPARDDAAAVPATAWDSLDCGAEMELEAETDVGLASEKLVVCAGAAGGTESSFGADSEVGWFDVRREVSALHLTELCVAPPVAG